MKSTPVPDVRGVQEIRTGFDHLIGYVVEIPPLFYPVTYHGLHDDAHGWSHSDDCARDAAEARRIALAEHENPGTNTLVDPGEPTFVEVVLRFLDHLTSDDHGQGTGRRDARTIIRS